MSSKSSSAQSTQQVDARRVLGENAKDISGSRSNINAGDGILAQSGASVTVLDNGAVSKAFDFSQNVGTAALDFVKSSQGQVADAYQEAKGRGVLTDWITIGAIAMAGLVAIQVAKR